MKNKFKLTSEELAQMKVKKEDLLLLKGGYMAPNNSAPNNCNTSSDCTCDYKNKPQVINSNEASGCSCNCI